MAISSHPYLSSSGKRFNCFIALTLALEMHAEFLNCQTTNHFDPSSNTNATEHFRSSHLCHIRLFIDIFLSLQVDDNESGDRLNLFTHPGLNQLLVLKKTKTLQTNKKTSNKYLMIIRS